VFVNSYENISHMRGGAPLILWNPNVDYVVNSQPLVPILSQINPAHTPTLFYFSKTQINPVHPLLFYLFKNSINIIIPHMLRSSKLFLSFRFPQQHLVCLLSSVLYVSYAPPISVSFNVITLVISCKTYQL
jgi:hypothetical protein